MSEKTLSNITEQGAKERIEDVKFWGEQGMWKLVSKARSEKEGWMKSTKAMQLPNGVLIQVSTQQGDNVAEALQFISNVKIVDIVNNGEVVGRILKSIL